MAVTNNEHYIKLAGLDWLVDNCIYRQEIVAGNLADFLKTGERVCPREFESMLHPLISVQSGLRTRKRQARSAFRVFEPPPNNLSPAEPARAHSRVDRGGS